jgi:hypothetical protein
MFFDVSWPWNADWLCLFWLRVSLTLVYAGGGVTKGFWRALGWRDGRLNSRLLQRVAIKERIQLE